MTANVADPIKLLKGVFSVFNTLWTRFNNVPAIEASTGREEILEGSKQSLLGKFNKISNYELVFVNN